MRTLSKYMKFIAIAFQLSKLARLSNDINNLSRDN